MANGTLQGSSVSEPLKLASGLCIVALVGQFDGATVELQRLHANGTGWQPLGAWTEGGGVTAIDGAGKSSVRMVSVGGGAACSIDWEVSA